MQQNLYYTLDYATHREEFQQHPIEVLEPTDPLHEKARKFLAKTKDRVSRQAVPVLLGVARLTRENERVAVLPNGTRLLAPTPEVLEKALERFGYYQSVQALKQALAAGKRGRR